MCNCTGGEARTKGQVLALGLRSVMVILRGLTKRKSEEEPASMCFVLYLIILASWKLVQIK